MVLNHPLHIEWKQRDRYRRILGTVYAASRPPSSQTTNVNIELTSEGWAWHYKKYSDDVGLKHGEQIARETAKGLWAGEPIAPWDWRNGVRKAAPQVSPESSKPKPAPSIRAESIEPSGNHCIRDRPPCHCRSPCREYESKSTSSCNISNAASFASRCVR